MKSMFLAELPTVAYDVRVVPTGYCAEYKIEVPIITSFVTTICCFVRSRVAINYGGLI